MNIYFDNIKPLFDTARSQGKTDAQMERDIGLPPHSINKWNSGKYKSYSNYLLDIAQYFNVTVSYLMGETEKRAPSEYIKTPATTTGDGLSEIKRQAIDTVSGMTDEQCKKLLEIFKLMQK